VRGIGLEPTLYVKYEVALLLEYDYYMRDGRRVRSVDVNRLGNRKNWAGYSRVNTVFPKMRGFD